MNLFLSATATPSTKECDFIVIGGGTGGLALATRLAEIESWEVCVVERGPKEGPMPGWSTNSYKWTSPHDPVWLTEPTLRTMETVHQVTKNVNKDGRIIYIPRWRGRGGTSRVYGSIVRRPSPEVLKLWPEGWKHDELLPYYKKSEDHYCHYDTEQSSDITPADCKYWHGKGGPMQVNPLLKEVFAAFPKAMTPVCEDKNMSWGGYAGDYNGPLNARASCSTFQQFKDRTNEKYYPTETARKDRAAKTARGSSYTGYFKYSKRQPTIIFNAPVTKILFDDTPTAIGVVYLDSTTGKTQELRARMEVILAGGAFDTPHLLQVSGVGPRDLLDKIKVPLVVENPYVGEHLWDHISVPYVLKLSDAADNLPESVNIDGTEHKNTAALFSINGPFSWILHLRSDVKERQPQNMTDVQLYVMGNSSLFDETEALCTTSSKTGTDTSDGSREGTIRIIDQWPEYRGSVKAQTSSIFDKPVLDYGWDYKLDNKVSPNFTKVAKVVRSQIRLLREIFFGEKASEVSKTFQGLVLDEVEPGLDKVTDEELDVWMRGMFVSALHPACTCKMPDCVDEFLRVKGVSNLRICDTSAFATQIDGNPVATIFAMSEKLADMLKKKYLDDLDEKSCTKTKGKKSNLIEADSSDSNDNCFD